MYAGIITITNSENNLPNNNKTSGKWQEQRGRSRGKEISTPFLGSTPLLRGISATEQEPAGRMQPREAGTSFCQDPCWQ
jgi:hypothetical protein